MVLPIARVLGERCPSGVECPSQPNIRNRSEDLTWLVMSDPAPRSMYGQCVTIFFRLTLSQATSSRPVPAGRLLAVGRVSPPEPLIVQVDGFVGKLDGPECVGHRAGGVGGDERVAGVGFGFAGVEVGDPPHGQPWR
ncbi:hypothetical protein GCM10009544_17120 [Streptomyces stramineus]|uniref:Uncharacterized protein n=1 Tax=Streptomyces stramineus TaxID=173861 RepID=A0ABN0ZPS0_9ACTN